MAKIFGSVIGALVPLVLGGLILVATQDPGCADDWWSCAPGGSTADTIQLIGVAVMFIGPFIGLRIGAVLGPKVDRAVGIGIAVGTIPGWVALALGLWLPYAGLLMAIGAAIGGVIARLRRSRLQPTGA